jgi:glucoamylase
MTRFRGDKNAFGGPGIEPRWTQGNKQGVGTAYSGDSHVWFTLWRGCITEVYYPTIDRPQIRDLQFLISDGSTFFQEEKRHLISSIERYEDHTLGYKIVNHDPDKRYKIVKEVVAAPHLSCILQHTKVDADSDFKEQLKLYALCAPHLNGEGWGNSGYVVEVAGREILVAENKGLWLALGANIPFSKLSCGYVGTSDGWTDLSSGYSMSWEFDCAIKGNIALTGEINVKDYPEFTLGLAFGSGLHDAVTTLMQALGIPFQSHRKKFMEQWQRVSRKCAALDQFSGDGGRLYRSSKSLLLAHEDKTFAGAMIASLSIPWGEIKGDEDKGGYHLVWTRDMVSSSLGLLAAGNTETPLRAMIYLAASQDPDGGFSQNFWVNGEPYWKGIQLDEVAFPILLAFRLHEEKGLGEFDPSAMVQAAARYLLVNGPATCQERWEEASGYSPSTLATNIAALICAACFARFKKNEAIANYLEVYADFLNRHVEDWTVTTEGTLVPGITRHYIRVNPTSIDHPDADENPNTSTVTLANGPEGSPNHFPAKEIVDAGFLELVRYGIREANDPLIVDSLKVVDAVLKKDTPYGPAWHRYNHDGYGQMDNGDAFKGHGRGRLWPLLTGERGHYELAAGGDVHLCRAAMEGFSSEADLLPEQVWDTENLPKEHMFLGKPTGAAMPLMWAHAEYIKLLRSIKDGAVFDFVPAVAARYLFEGRRKLNEIDIWKLNHRTRQITKGFTLRIQMNEPFQIRWSLDNWKTTRQSHSEWIDGLNLHYCDLPTNSSDAGPIRFAVYFEQKNQWGEREFQVELV